MTFSNEVIVEYNYSLFERQAPGEFLRTMESQKAMTNVMAGSD